MYRDLAAGVIKQLLDAHKIETGCEPTDFEGMLKVLNGRGRGSVTTTLIMNTLVHAIAICKHEEAP